MCLNCGCGMNDDDMGNADNLTVKTLAKAAVAGNDGDAASFLEETKKSLERVSTEELQKEIDAQKAQD